MITQNLFSFIFSASGKRKGGKSRAQKPTVFDDTSVQHGPPQQSFGQPQPNFYDPGINGNRTFRPQTKSAPVEKSAPGRFGPFPRDVSAPL
jgi:hypothetical protein